MQLKQAPRATSSSSGIGLKVLLCLLLVPVFAIYGSAEASGGGPGNSIRLGILPNQLAIAYTSTAYSATIHVVGGSAPYQFSYIRGVIPPGLYLNTATGTVAGTPTAAGSYNFRMGITDLPNSDRGEVTVYVIVRGATTPNTPGITVAVSPGSATVASSGTQQFSATVSNTSNTAVTWTTTAGTISTSGLFTAPSVSSATAATVTATSVADPTKQAQATVTVSAPAAVSISVSPSSSSLISGSSQQFTATVNNTSNTGVMWSATGGTITSGGVFTAASVSSPTSAVVTATSVADTTKSAHSSVTVNPPATISVTVSPALTILASAGTQQFTATVSNTSNAGVSWSASAGSISSNGLFTAPSVSSTTTATVTATSLADNTKWGQATVSVNPTNAPPPPPTPTSGYDGPAELPRAYMLTTMADTPAPGTTTLVSAGGNLQAALNNANCGDTIQLAAGATFSGLFTLPAKPCDDQNWIIVRTSAPDSSLPPEGSRMTPCYSGVASLPGRPSFNCSSPTNALAKVIYPQVGGAGPFQLASGANHYRLVGLEVARTPGTGLVGALISTASGGAADHLVIDRVWLHGSPQDDTMAGMGVDSMTYAAIVDSYVTDFHCTSVTGACTDAHSVIGGNSSVVGGPYRITGNFLEASGENVMFGGGSATTTPTDIEIRQNHFFKPLTWMSGQPGFVGGLSGNPFMVKNHLELKNAQRVLVEGNIFENSWGGFSQVGYSVLLTPKNQAGSNGTNLCPICAVTDVTIRYNTISHAGAGISLANVLSNNNGAALAGERYSIHDVTIDDISASKYKGSGALIMVMSGWPANSLNSILINHVTGFPDPGNSIMILGNSTANQPMSGFTMTNSIIGQSLYPIWSAGGTTNCAFSDVPVSSLNACFPSGYSFSDNAFVAVNQSNYPPTKWPAGNLFPSSAATTGFVNFNGGNGGNYQLVSSSPYKNAGTDGKDLGADISTIQSLTANVY